MRANPKSISHRCHLFEVAFVLELTQELFICPWVASRAEVGVTLGISGAAWCLAADRLHGRALLSHMMYVLIDLRKSTPRQNRQIYSGKEPGLAKLARQNRQRQRGSALEATQGQMDGVLVSSHANTTSKRWHLWEIDLGFPLNSAPGWMARP